MVLQSKFLEFVRITSISVGVLFFIQHVGFLIMFSRLKLSHILDKGLHFSVFKSAADLHLCFRICKNQFCS